MSEKRVAVLATEFKAINPGQVVTAAKTVAKSMDEIAAAAARQEAAAAAARKSSSGTAQAAATAAARAAADTRAALELQADVAKGIGRTTSAAAVDAQKNFDAVSAAAAKAAAKIREEASRPVDSLKLKFAIDDQGVKERLAAALADKKRIEGELKRLKPTGSSRSQRERFEAQREELQFDLGEAERVVRTWRRNLVTLKTESATALRDAASAAGEAAREQIKAEEAKVAAVRTTLAEAKIADAEKQIADKAAADAGVLAAKRQEAETIKSGKARVLAEIKAAKEQARANEKAAADAAAAWRRSQDRIRSFSTAMPRLGLLPGGGAGGLLSSLATRGTLPVVYGLMRGAASAAASAASVIGSAFSGALGAIGSVGKAVWNVSTGLVGIVGNAIKAAAALAWNVGSGAVKAVLALGSAAVDAAAKVARIARTVVVRTVLVGAGLGAAAAGAAYKATSGAAEASKEALDNSIDTGSGLYNSQALSAAAKRAGVDQKDLAAAMGKAREAMRDLSDNPELLRYFERLGVATRTADGRLLDTTTILQDVLAKSRQLGYGESVDMLDRLFGSREGWEKIYPLITGIADANNSLLNAGLARQMQLGSLVTDADVLRMRAMKAAQADFRDSITGLKLAISRAVGNDVIRGVTSLANAIALSRGTIAALAKRAYDFSTAATLGFLRVAGAVYRIARYGDAARVTLDFGRYLNIGWYRGLIEAVSAVREFGVEAYRAFAGIRRQQGQTGQVFISARQWIIDLVATGFYAQKALASTIPFWRDLWAALAGNEAGVTRYTWLVTVRRWIGDLYNTLAGRDSKITDFPGLITARDAFLSLGRAAREVWYALSGQDDKIVEFPIIARIKGAITGAIAWVRQFAVEAWDAVTNGSAVAEPKFPWMYSAAAAVRQFVADVKTTWADLGNVWNGGTADTTLGAWLGKTINYFQQGEAYLRYFVATAQQVWNDLVNVFAGNTQDNVRFNFPWIKDIAQGFETIYAAGKKAWEMFQGVFGFLDRIVQRFTFGNVRLESLILFTTMMSLFGVFRTVGLVVWAARAAFSSLGGILTRVGAALGGGAVAAGAGAAGAAGAGMIGAMAAAGTATQTAGGKAATAAGKWDRLKSAISGVRAPMLGLAAIAASVAGALAGDWAMSNAATNSAAGRAMSMGGGALQYGAMGAGLGMMAGPWGAAIGGGAGALYGAFAGNSEYVRRSAEAKAREESARRLIAEGRGEEARAVLEGGSHGWNDDQGSAERAEFDRLQADADAAMADVKRLQSEAAGAARRTADSFAKEDWAGAGTAGASSVAKAFGGFDFGSAMKGLGDGAKNLFSGLTSSSGSSGGGMAGAEFLPPQLRLQALSGNGYYDASRYPAYADPLSAASTRPVPAPQQTLAGAVERFEVAIPGLDLVINARGTAEERTNIRQQLDRRGGSPQWSWEGVQP